MKNRIPRSSRSALCLLLVGLLTLISAVGGAAAPSTARTHSASHALPAGSWDTRFSQANGLRLDGYGVDAIAFNGQGEIVVAGAFSWAGTTDAHMIAKWNGTAWQPLARTGGWEIRALAVSGDTVYAGGRFERIDGVAANNIARWDGTRWTALGTGIGNPNDFNLVQAIALRGGEVYAGGIFRAAGGASVNNIARWDGTRWTALQTAGSSANGVNDSVDALAFNGGILYVGGHFTQAGGMSANSIAQWNGSAWSTLGSGITNNSRGYAYLYSLVVSGGELYVAGNFSEAGGVPADSVAKWNGSAWSGFGEDLNYWVITEIAVVDSKVYIVGSGHRSDILRWDGSQWVMLSEVSSIQALAAYGGKLYVGGYFTQIDETAANGIARWDGSRWQGFGRGLGQHGVVRHMATHRNTVYVTGRFHQAGALQAIGHAYWNGSNWSVLGTKLSLFTTSPIAVADSGVYSIGYVDGNGGSGLAVMKWDGTRWIAVSGIISSDFVDPEINALVAEGTNVYVAGMFEWIGSTQVQNIAVWNGSTWSALDAGVNGTINDLALSDNNLYVGGQFTQAGGVAAHNIARWNGTQWSALSSGTENGVTDLAATGDTVYAATFFQMLVGNYNQRIVKWDGAQWSSLGVGIPSHPDHLYEAPVHDIAVHPISRRVYVGGRFNRVIDGTTAHSTEVTANNIAVWDGSHWSALGSGVNDQVNAIVTTGNSVYVGGSFREAGGHSAYGFTRWTERLVTYLPIAASTTR